MDEYEAYINKSRERLKLSKLAYDNNLYESSISQSYYTMFLATKAHCVVKGF